MHCRNAPSPCSRSPAGRTLRLTGESPQPDRILDLKRQQCIGGYIDAATASRKACNGRPTDPMWYLRFISGVLSAANSASIKSLFSQDARNPRRGNNFGKIEYPTL